MRPLEGLRILDFSTLLPGPLATLIMAEAGADVVKVEPPGGEAMRHFEPKWGTDGSTFALLNRGKKSVVADLKQEADHRKVSELAATADIVVEQFRPGVMDRLGFGYDDLSQRNPGLIYCSITGYGQTGPRAREAGHDLNFLGETGLLGLSYGTIDDAVLPAAPVGDIGGGTYPAVINILLALAERHRTGRGRHLDIAMCENVFPFLYWALAQGLPSGDWPGEGDHLVTGASPRYRIYATQDGGGLVVAAIEQKFWTRFCDVIDLDEGLRDDARDPVATGDVVARIVGSATTAAWAARLAGKDCCCTIMKTVDRAMDQPHFQARRVFGAQLANADGDRIAALPLPIDRAFRSGTENTLTAPVLGSHSDWTGSR